MDGTGEFEERGALRIRDSLKNGLVALKREFKEYNGKLGLGIGRK